MPSSRALRAATSAGSLSCIVRPASREAACSAATPLASSDVCANPTFGVVPIGGEAARQHERILDTLGSTLSHERQHRMGGNGSR
jgi:hypothetical protein